jgi:hypothetical protein
MSEHCSGVWATEKNFFSGFYPPTTLTMLTMAIFDGMPLSKMVEKWSKSAYRRAKVRQSEHYYL